MHEDWEGREPSLPPPSLHVPDGLCARPFCSGGRVTSVTRTSADLVAGIVKALRPRQWTAGSPAGCPAVTVGWRGRRCWQTGLG